MRTSPFFLVLTVILLMAVGALVVGWTTMVSDLSRSALIASQAAAAVGVVMAAYAGRALSRSDFHACGLCLTDLRNRGEEGRCPLCGRPFRQDELAWQWPAGLVLGVRTARARDAERARQRAAAGSRAIDSEPRIN